MRRYKILITIAILLRFVIPIFWVPGKVRSRPLQGPRGTLRRPAQLGGTAGLSFSEKTGCFKNLPAVSEWSDFDD